MTWDKNLVTTKNGSIILVNHATNKEIEVMVTNGNGKLKKDIKLNYTEFQDLLNTANDIQRGYNGH
jgi:hypothetical protein